ncbi:Tumor necrosis factor receptor superfamily member 16, partial [Frankliniella fusca]
TVLSTVRWNHDRPRVRNGGKNSNPSGGRLERFREPARAGSRHGRPPPRQRQIATLVATRQVSRSPPSSPLGTHRHFRRQTRRFVATVATEIATSGKPGVSDGPPPDDSVIARHEPSRSEPEFPPSTCVRKMTVLYVSGSTSLLFSSDLLIWKGVTFGYCSVLYANIIGIIEYYRYYRIL